MHSTAKLANLLANIYKFFAANVQNSFITYSILLLLADSTLLLIKKLVSKENKTSFF